MKETKEKNNMVVYGKGESGAAEINNLLTQGWKIEHSVSDGENGVFFTLSTEDFGCWLVAMPKYMSDPDMMESVEKAKTQYFTAIAEELDKTEAARTDKNDLDEKVDDVKGLSLQYLIHDYNIRSTMVRAIISEQEEICESEKFDICKMMGACGHVAMLIRDLYGDSSYQEEYLKHFEEIRKKFERE